MFKFSDFCYACIYTSSKADRKKKSQVHHLRSTSGEAAQHLTELPQLPGHGIIFGLCPHFLCSAAREVVSTQLFKTLLQGAVQRGLSSVLWSQEEQTGHRLNEDLLPQADVSGQFCTNNSCRAREIVLI